MHTFHKRFLRHMGIAAVSALVLDLVVGGLLLAPLFHRELGIILRDSHTFAHGLASLGVYLILGFVHAYVILDDKSHKKTLVNAAILGACIYGIYELTNYALVFHWSALIVLVDILWGVVLNCAAAELVWRFK